MFDRLEDIIRRYEDITMMLGDPSVVSDQEKFRSLMKEQKSLEALVECYKEYKDTRQTIEDSLQLLDEESDLLVVVRSAEMHVIRDHAVALLRSRILGVERDDLGQVHGIGRTVDDMCSLIGKDRAGLVGHGVHDA